MTQARARQRFKRRLLTRLSMLAEADADTDGFAELVEECQIPWESALRIAKEHADQLQRRADRLKAPEGDEHES